MTNATSAERYVGLRAVDQHGRKIGSVERVHVDETTGHPSWVTVNTGPLRNRKNLVPLRGSRVCGSDLVLPFDKDVIKESPPIANATNLDRDEEQSLYDYYLSIMAATSTPAGRSTAERRP